MQRTLGAAKLISPAAIALHAFEIGQHIRIAPPLTPGLAPPLVIQRIAADETHAIDRRGSPKSFAPIML